jgi:DNA-binding response OmpR family regulator
MNSTTKLVPHRDLMTGLSERKILIVDDEPLVVRTVAAYLRQGGFHNLRHETDSRQVIEAIRDFKPDMVLLDIFMPHICGLQLLEQISANPAFDKIIVLMLSAAGQDEERRSLEMGAMGFLPKPTGAVELIRIISTTFRIANRFGTR